MQSIAIRFLNASDGADRLLDNFSREELTEICNELKIIRNETRIRSEQAENWALQCLERRNSCLALAIFSSVLGSLFSISEGSLATIPLIIHNFVCCYATLSEHGKSIQANDHSMLYGMYIVLMDDFIRTVEDRLNALDAQRQPLSAPAPRR